MNNYDYISLCRLLQKLESELNERLINLEHRYDLFNKKIDVLDLVDLMELKNNLQYFDYLSQKILLLCDYLLKYNGENC